jgi:hypothetical protein
MSDKTTSPGNPAVPAKRGAVRPHYVKLYWLAFLLCLAYYFGIAAFPMGPFKGDGTGMASGARQIVEQGWNGPKIDYGRETRPGVFWALIFARRFIGADTYLAFSVMALAAGILNVVLMACFAGRLIRVPAPLCGIGILVLFPDSATWGCYPNGTVLAGCLGMASFCLLTREDKLSPQRLILAGILAGLAILPRVDAVLLGLVSVPLLMAGDARTTFKRIGIFGGAALAVAGGGLYASGFDVLYVLKTTQEVLGGSAPPAEGLVLRLVRDESFTSCLAFFPLVTGFLMIGGFVRLCRERNWKVLTLVVAGAGPVLLVYANQVRLSPLYYLTGLFACLALAGLEGIASMGRTARIGFAAVAGVLFALQYPVGINVALRAKPWYPLAGPTLVRLWEKDPERGPIAKISVGIGAGGAVPNLERVRFCSGLLFHPLAFHAAKQTLLDSFTAMKDGIQARENEKTPMLVYTSEWASCSQVHKALQDLGYTCTERTHLGPADMRAERYVWRRDRFTIIHVDAWETFDPWNHRGFFPEELPRKRLLYVTGGGRERTIVEASGRVTNIVCRKEMLPSECVCAFEIDISPRAAAN